MRDIKYSTDDLPDIISKLSTRLYDVKDAIEFGVIDTNTKEDIDYIEHQVKILNEIAESINETLK